MSSKLERDIEEVLAKVEQFPSKRPLGNRVRRRIAGLFSGAGRLLAGIPKPRISVGQVLLLGIAVIVVAYVFGDAIGSPSLVRLLIGGGIVLFIGGFIFSLRRQSAARTPAKRWRGQTMELDESAPGPWWRRWRSRR